jgi:hypothetical protein
MMGDRGRGHRLRVGATASVTTEEAKWQALAGAIKRCSKHEFTRHPNSTHDVPSTSCYMATVSKTGLTIAEGAATLSVPR